MNAEQDILDNRLEFNRFFTNGARHPLDQVFWRVYDAILKAPDGTIKFEQKGVEIPAFWSDRSANIVAEKYFRVINGVKEHSARQMISRVSQSIAKAAFDHGLLQTEEERTIFEEELAYLLVNQMFAFNSPVWFNVGVVEEPQCSACFILGVQDDMESLTSLQAKEVRLFKGGSGAGSNLSPLRSSYEKLSGGGYASGPVSFMEGFDSWAGVTKSGGTTRRAAKMVRLDVTHPDILEQRDGRPGFIKCKQHAEKVARDLYLTGKYTAEFNVPGNVYELVPFQNANNSVGVTDEFMSAVDQDLSWETKARNGDVIKSYLAREIWDAMCKAAHDCGDPGIQFDDTINEWNTCKASGRINGSNPCSEFLFLDNSACNLGSLNLLKFVDGDGRFRINSFRHAVKIAITAMEALVSYSSYPSPEIAYNSETFRPLGLGYANLGAMLMYMGLPYDSDAGRAIAAAVTALMSGTAYAHSSSLASRVGPFAGYDENRDSVLEVLKMHREALFNLPTDTFMPEIVTAAREEWDFAIKCTEKVGVRNSQVTLLAPTGTIAFLMDCDTTGIEPALAVVTYKKLVGGGTIKMPCQMIEPALARLGYSGDEIEKIVAHIAETGDILTSQYLKQDHINVFQTSLGMNAVPPMAHLKMMAAAQPFLSGAISKTVNIPDTASVDDVNSLYWNAWKLGLKCVAIYRDGCKLSQPAGATLKSASGAKKELMWGQRKKMPDERGGVIHKFRVGQQEGYLHVGMYPDGTPGEIFVNVAKAGSALSGLMDQFATMLSIALQHGAPLGTIVEKLRDAKFEPAGMTNNPQIRMATSLPDYIAKYLEQKFLGATEQIADVDEKLAHAIATEGFSGDPCSRCGNITIRAGSCWVCTACGTTTGCG